MRPVFVAGVGMTAFTKPGSSGRDYPDLAREAGTKALVDAGIDYDAVEQVVVGYVYGESCSGQRAAYELGLTGVPIYNVNSNCSTGSSALMLARQLVEGGSAEVVLVLGFERMQTGSLSAGNPDRAHPLDRHLATIFADHSAQPGPIAPQLYAAAAREHMSRYGSEPRHFAMIAEKNHRHSAVNPNAQFQRIFTLDDIESAPEVSAPLTRLQCSPTSDGAGAAVLMSEAALDRYAPGGAAVQIVAQAMTTDTSDSFEPGGAIAAIGTGMTKRAADKAYSTAGIGPQDVDVIELHDCFSPNELLTYESLGLAVEGKGHLLVEQGETTYGGRWVVNPSGGLISKGHPLGATGLAQCAELTWQLRGQAGQRQVPGARVGLQHNMGLGGAAVVTIYRAL